MTDGSRCRLVVHVVEPLETGRDCDGLILLDPSISRRHLLVEPFGSTVVVTDLGSRNGTTVAGHPLIDHHRLGHDEVVRFGSCTLSLAPTTETDVAGGAGAAVVVATAIAEADQHDLDVRLANDRISRAMVARHGGSVLGAHRGAHLFGFDSVDDAVAFANSLLRAASAHGAANPMHAVALHIGIDTTVDGASAVARDGQRGQVVLSAAVRLIVQRNRS